MLDWLLSLGDLLATQSIAWIETDAAKTVVGAIGGAVTTVIVQSIFKSSRKTIKNWRVSRLAKRGSLNMKNGQYLEFGPKIIVTDESLEPSGEKFFLPLPKRTIEKLSSRPGYDSSKLLDFDVFGRSSLAEVSRIIGDAVDADVLNRHIDLISKQFENDEDGIRFNGMLFGLRQIRLNTRTDHDEVPVLSAKIYETNYFTFRVMDSLHREVIKTNPMYSLKSYKNANDLNTRLYPFIASISINAFVMSSDEKIILVERSRNSALFGREPQIYPSVNEALSPKDIRNVPGLGSLPSLESCLLRGLKEELGIRAHSVASYEFTHFGFGSVGIGFGVYAFVRANLTADEIVNGCAGTDRGIEVGNFVKVPFTSRGLRRIINDRKTAEHVSTSLRLIAAAKLIPILPNEPGVPN